MALPSKQKFTHFLVQFWHMVVQYPVLNHIKLSTLRNAMLESITEDEGLNGQKLAAFFEEKAYLNKQRELHALATQAIGQKEAKILHSVQSALEQLRVAFTALQNPLPLEAAERVLPFPLLKKKTQRILLKGGNNLALGLKSMSPRLK